MRLVEGRVAIDDVDACLDRLAAIGSDHGCAVQAFDARRVAGPTHLETAVERARWAHGHDEAIADDPAVEILLYAAGRRQIDRALALGVDPTTEAIVLVVDGGDEAAAVADLEAMIEPASVLGTARDEAFLIDYFGITSDELAATDASLEALVCERVVLLTIDK